MLCRSGWRRSRSRTESTPGWLSRGAKASQGNSTLLSGLGQAQPLQYAVWLAPVVYSGRPGVSIADAKPAPSPLGSGRGYRAWSQTFQSQMRSLLPRHPEGSSPHTHERAVSIADAKPDPSPQLQHLLRHQSIATLPALQITHRYVDFQSQMRSQFPRHFR